MKKCIILANGEVPKKSELKYFINTGYKTLICADGGANSALKLNITPDYIIGDFDSVTKKSLNYFKNKSKKILIKRQNDTDVEKCLKYAIKKKFCEAILLGGTGDRLDHSFCNLGIVLKYYDKILVKVLHGKSILIPYSGKVELSTIVGEVISIYGIDKNTKIKSKGLKYKINNALPFGIKESTSNQAVSSNISLEIKGGKILVIRNYETMKKHGLI